MENIKNTCCVAINISDSPLFSFPTCSISHCSAKLVLLERGSHRHPASGDPCVCIEIAVACPHPWLPESWALGSEGICDHNSSQILPLYTEGRATAKVVRGTSSGLVLKLYSTCPAWRFQLSYLANSLVFISCVNTFNTAYYSKWLQDSPCSLWLCQLWKQADANVLSNIRKEAYEFWSQGKSNSKLCCPIFEIGYRTAWLPHISYVSLQRTRELPVEF